jgi:NodT family efflux transporter outer membrane factor (OMF) lipoprotein
MNALRHCIILGLTFASVACVGPGPVRPQARLVDPASLQASAAVNSLRRDADWPTDHWWSRLHDPQLNDLVAQAVARRPDLRAAQARLDEAVAQARVEGALLSPQLQTDGAINRQRFAPDTSASPPGGYTVWNNEVSIDLSYDLDIWGRDRASLKSAVGVVRATEAELQAVRIAIEGAVVRAYVRLWMQYRLLDAFDSLSAQASRARDIVAARHRAGLSNSLELAQAETLVATSADDLEEARHDIALLRNELGALSGLGPGHGDTLARPAIAIGRDALLPDALPANLLGRRPDIVARRWRVESASEGIHVARAAFYPNVDLVAAASLGSLATTGGFLNFISHDGAGRKYGVALSLPLFDGGRRQGEYSVAVATYDGAVEAYNQSILDALHDVADGVSGLETLQSQVRQAERAKLAVDRAYKLASEGYRNGITEFLDVLTVQDTQSRQEQHLIKTQAEQLDTWARLMQALGGGTSPAPSPPSLPEG